MQLATSSCLREPYIIRTFMFLDLFPQTIFGLVHDKDSRNNYCKEYRQLPADFKEKALKADYGVFFTPNGIGSVKKPGGVLLRWDGNITSLNACFVDLDKGSKQNQLVALNKAPAVPSIIVESKRGYHAYWLLSDKSADKTAISLWRRIQTTIANTLEGDTACSNPSRLMRLPGSFHVKGEPFEVVIHSVTNSAYTLSEMELAFPPPPRPIYFATDRKYAKKIFVPPIQALHEGERHPALNKAAGTLYANALSKDFPLIREALKTWYSLSCINLKRDWEKEVDSVCGWLELREHAK